MTADRAPIPTAGELAADAYRRRAAWHVRAYLQSELPRRWYHTHAAAILERAADAERPPVNHPTPTREQ